jgi:pyruvate,water dikinase
MGYVLDLQALDAADSAVAGGKGAVLGDLSRLHPVRVPAGFCVTTQAFERVIAGAPSIDQMLASLPGVDGEDAGAIRRLSAELRRVVHGLAIPDDVASAVTRAVAELGEDTAYAVRSSATAEDLPTASFAGQYDSYLNVGASAVLDHVARCWASLFSERALAYRVKNGFAHRHVRMAVVVQRMVSPDSAGTVFTADPVSGSRRVASVEASFGLGEALASGLVNPDRFTVRDGVIVARMAQHSRPALADAQVLRLVRLARRIEAHFGHPQDIEWCLADGEFWILQSRPITTLFPIPLAADGEKHVYVSVGHGQMMTDAMKPLGISMWQLTAMAPMHEAGGRLFVDVTQRLASPVTRAGLLEVLGRGDPLIGDALESVVERGDFLPALADESPRKPTIWDRPVELEADPAIVAELIERDRDSLVTLRRDIRAKSGPALFDFLLDAFEEHKRVLGDSVSLRVIAAGMQATWWLNERFEEWLGEKNAADAIALFAPGNVTAEMGLALLDVADAIRPHPEVVRFLRRVAERGCAEEAFLDELSKLPGGGEAREAIAAYLQSYGMRCVGEIDITRPRWSERPTTLVPMLLDNVRNFSAGEAKRRVEMGRQAAQRKEQELLKRLSVLPDADSKVHEARRMIERVRTFSGYREYPKYGIVSRYFVYKQALLAEAERLVDADVLHDKEDVFYLTFHEFRDLTRTHRADQRLIRRRKEAFGAYQALTPPRVLTSDGEIIAGAYRRDDVPPGALIGIAVSAGTVEGRARVVRDIADAEIEPGDILVTTYTDPSWTPLFLAADGLVTEVGGLMTHGAVIAREYGLPAVVGVDGATNLITDGQRIRVHGTEGYVEVLQLPGR